MKKIYLISFVSICSLLVSCSETVVEDGLVTDREESRSQETASGDVIDLGREELANCYIVTAPGTYMFKADNRFNLGDGLPVPPEIAPADARLIWQTEKGSVTSVELTVVDEEPYVRFEVERAYGNAVIAALDSEGTVCWSWHIWMPAQSVTGIKTASGYEVMNMNLGAMCNTPGDASSYGMLYQWGRKDPFPASATLTGTTSTVSAPMYDIDGNPVTIGYSSWYNSNDNTLEYAVSHPTVCLSNYSMYATTRDWLRDGDDSLWGNPQGYAPSGDVKFPESGRKTCYDPSPAGWRVAPADVFHDFTTSGGYAWDIADFNVVDSNGDGVKDINDYDYGWHFLMPGDTPLYFPAAARFDGSYAMLMGSMSGLWGNYWSNAPYPGISGGAFCCLSFQVKAQDGSDMISVSPSAGASRADAYSVRCVRDVEKNDNSGIKPVYPD